MDAGAWFRKVFVPENQEAHDGTPQESASVGMPDASMPPMGTPEPPGSTGIVPPPPEDGNRVDENAGQPVPVEPEIRDDHEEYHYAAFDEEGGSGLWNNHTRIILAMVVVFISAVIMWMILI